MSTYEVEFKSSQPVHFLGNDENPDQVWVICHGYGQTAAEFMEDFKNLDLAKVLMVFPESISRFYHRGHSGRVVGSWMTRLYRLQDIRNQNEYISAVWEDLKTKGLLNDGVKRVGFGFSQGGATIARWADQNSDMVDELILWGCRFPPDLMDENLKNFRDEKLVRSFTGDQDEFFPPVELKKLKEMFSDVKNLDWQIYEGGHQVDQEIMKTLI